LPLILKPDGQGKLSKRDGDRLGFPVFAMDWMDPKTGELTKGFKEMGFLPEAFINMLAMLGWNDGSAEEIFDKETLTERFTIERIHKGGAKFDFEKAKWFNQEWIKKSASEKILPYVVNQLTKLNIELDEEKLLPIITLVKDRCQLLNDFVPQIIYFFKDPEMIDTASIQTKWDENKVTFFNTWISRLEELTTWNPLSIETHFKEQATASGIKPGELQLPIRIMLVGAKFGPPVFEITAIIGKETTIRRINHGLKMLQQ
jgi:glutamyl-tRNA synthetase